MGMRNSKAHRHQTKMILWKSSQISYHALQDTILYNVLWFRVPLDLHLCLEHVSPIHSLYQGVIPAGWIVLLPPVSLQFSIDFISGVTAVTTQRIETKYTVWSHCEMIKIYTTNQSDGTQHWLIFILPLVLCHLGSNNHISYGMSFLYLDVSCLGSSFFRITDWTCDLRHLSITITFAAKDNLKSVSSLSVGPPQGVWCCGLTAWPLHGDSFLVTVFCM